MAARVLLVLAALAACAQSVDISILSTSSVTAKLQTNANGGLNLLLKRKELSEVIAVVGHRAGTALDNVTTTGGEVVIQFPNSTTVRIANEAITGERTGNILTFTWSAPRTAVLEDCVYLGSNHWYGGPQQKRQYWPIERLVLPEYSYVTKEADNCGVAEPYWLNNEGIFYFFDKSVPLFVDQNNKMKNAACFIAEIKAPYSNLRDSIDLIYAIGIFDDVRIAHEYAVERFLGKPTGYPDELMIRYPIWSTWAKYKSAINADIVQEFADEITRNGFPNSQFELDDLWEICYGAMTVDVNRFPDMKATMNTLRAKGYRVTMWAHPFLNKGCEPWYTEAKNAGYIVSAESDNRSRALEQKHKQPLSAHSVTSSRHSCARRASRSNS